MLYFLIFIFIILFIIFLLLYIQEKNKKIKIIKINEKIKKQNEEIYNENESLLEKQRIISNIYKQKQQELAEMEQNIQNAEQISRKAFENYNDVLDKEYILKEQEHNEALQLLSNSYSNIQNKLNAEIGCIRAELDSISATRAAAIQAQLKEEEIKQQADFYSLSIDEIDLREARILQSIESELRDPRPIRMII